jgi:hypothetical protein
MAVLAPGTTSRRARGADAISIIEYLGECDRNKATVFLRNLTDRLAEVEVR